jgi:hypothetical protein
MKGTTMSTELGTLADRFGKPLPQVKVGDYFGGHHRLVQAKHTGHLWMLDLITGQIDISTPVRGRGSEITTEILKPFVADYGDLYYKGPDPDGAFSHCRLEDLAMSKDRRKPVCIGTRVKNPYGHGEQMLVQYIPEGRICGEDSNNVVVATVWTDTGRSVLATTVKDAYDIQEKELERLYGKKLHLWEITYDPEKG